MTELSFGQWLKRRRQALGMTQEELARRVNYSLATIRKVEADERVPSRQLAEALADGLQVASDERAVFLRFARDDLRQDLPALPAEAVIPVHQPTQVTFHVPPNPGFVGREREVADIATRLTQLDCRLLTLTGPGGIGNTRLALALARRLADSAPPPAEVADGVLFVPLAAVTSEAEIVSALAAAARFEFYGNIPPRQQILDYLRNKRMLLVLDNFEHLLDAAGLVADLLATAAHVRVLTTSREALRLRGECFYPIEGLAFPGRAETLDAEALARYDAAQLFAQCARRVRRDFDLGREGDAVAHLCQLVEGMPLALELAAAWLRALSVRQVVAALERGQDILTARDRDAPERHRSLRAVLEQSWRLLSVEEQRVLARLSVFWGGCDTQAAEAVTATALDVLASLVEKSLLRASPEGRFQLHELVRQFAAEKLTGATGDAARTHERHCIYYTGFLARQTEALLDGRQREAATEITAELENGRAAWLWAAEQARWALIASTADALYYYYILRSSYTEGEELFSAAILRRGANSAAADPALASLRGRLLARRGMLRSDIGEYEDASADLRAALMLHPEGIERGFVLRGLGWLEGQQGKLSLAESHLRAGAAISREWGDKNGLAEALHNLAHVAGMLAQYQKGKGFGRECLALARQLGRTDLEARALQVYAWSACCLGEYEEAEQYYAASLELAVGLHDRRAMAVALQLLGWIRWCMGGPHLEAARAYYERGLALGREIGDRVFVAMGLGDVALALTEAGDHEAAIRSAEQGRRLAGEIGDRVYLAY
ncbi:MAG: tetratricopeptide repeat protein, partial [Anaerolineae bacterium]|nr:tetratricopeptide repeat protein [Anaerolineae bacterium]